MCGRHGESYRTPNRGPSLYPFPAAASGSVSTADDRIGCASLDRVDSRAVTLASAIAGMGGIARTRELRARGFSPSEIATAIRHGSIQRLRIGWYGSRSLPDHVVRAHRVGGRPACVTVAAAHGLWMLEAPVLHIEVAPSDSRFRSPSDASRAIRLRGHDDVIAHWVSRTDSMRAGQPLDRALAQMVGCVSELAAVSTIDSALNHRITTLDRVASHLSERAQAILRLCDPTAESGVESIFRLRGQKAGFKFRCQVELPGGRVDFVLGERLLVEVDGSEHHSGHAEFVRDRERDALHKALGYVVVRFTYEQVVHRWHEVESVLFLIVSRGEHLWPPRIRRSGRRAG